MDAKLFLFVFCFFSLSIGVTYAESGKLPVENSSILYKIDGGQATSAILEQDFNELVIIMTTTSDGSIEIEIPRSILDSKFGGMDDIFFVLVDGFETDYVEIRSNQVSRTIVIPFFVGDSQVTIIGTESTLSVPIVIPDWIRNNAGWWSKGKIMDSDFISGIQYLITKGIMTIPTTDSGSGPGSEIPPWVKNNAGWWSEGKIKDSDFVSGIQYLISKDILKV